jgi:hypothetical protein
MNNDAGILYIATGREHNLEAVRSARSAKACMPSLPTALFTDVPPGAGDANLFDQVTLLKAPSHGFQDKILPLKQTPFRKTLFVDSDTVFLESITEVFDLLDRFELAYCHAPVRQASGESNRARGVPQCFPEANTGILAYQNSAAFQTLVDAWDDLYAERRRWVIPPSGDQPVFREVLYHARINAYVLPPEYNLRTILPMYKGAALRPKILHGRGRSLERALRVVGPTGLRFGMFDFSEKPSAGQKARMRALKFIRSTPLGFLIR